MIELKIASKKMWWMEGHREFADWVKKNYHVEPFDYMIQTTRRRNGNINSKVFWNNDRRYPEVGDYVTNVSAGPYCYCYVGKVTYRSKGKRPRYNVEILYSYDADETRKENLTEGYFLARLDKKDNWKPWV